MRPILYSAHLFGQEFALHSYGVAIATGFLVAIFLGARQARRVGEDPDAVLELCFWLLVSSMIGARLLFVLTNLHAYGEACSDGIAEHSLSAVLWGCTRALHVWEGGLVFYGGLLGATGFAWWFTRRRNLSFRRIADVLAPQIALGHFFGRLGCYAAGCCWGRPAGGWAPRFPSESLAFQQMVTDGLVAPSSTLTPPLHPVQLYEAFGELALYFLLSLYARKKRYDGQILVAYLGAYALLRFVVERYRGDAIRRFLVPGVSTSQLLALLTLPLAFALALRWRRRPVTLSRT
jgi:phosphatidylglycerol:prolipoprotein diacylglycerol transferase